MVSYVGDCCSMGLVLGSGAIRGLAHIGVLRALEEARITPDLVVGASAGALVGALYCTGADLGVLEGFVRNLSWRQLADFGVRRGGLIRGDRVSAVIRLLLRGCVFADCNPPFAATATSLLRGEPVIITEGLLADAVRASISIPGVFPPVRTADDILVDGGVSSRVPVAVARGLGARVVVAVDVVPHPGGWGTPNTVFECILQALEILELHAARASLADADVVIAPQVGAVSPLDLSRTSDLVRAGEVACRAALPGIIRALGG